MFSEPEVYLQLPGNNQMKGDRKLKVGRCEALKKEIDREPLCVECSHFVKKLPCFCPSWLHLLEIAVCAV